MAAPRHHSNHTAVDMAIFGTVGSGFFEGQDQALRRQMMQQAVQQQARQQQEWQQEQARQDAIRRGMGPGIDALQQMRQPPPQQMQTPPMPGQGSVPQQPQPQQAPPQPLGAGMPGGMPLSQPPQQQGQMGSPPPLGAPGGMAPPKPYTSPQPPPPPPPQAQGQGMPPPPQQAPPALQSLMPDLPSMMKKLTDQGMDGETAFGVANRFEHMLSQEGRMQLAAANSEVSRLRAMASQEQAAAAMQRAGTGAAGEERRAAREAGATPMGDSIIAKNLAQAAASKARAAKFNLAGAGGGGAGGGAAGAAGSGGKTGLSDSSLDLAAWNYINTRALTYRKGKGGPNDPNTAVMNKAAEIGKSLDKTPEELAAMPAEYKADAQSLYMQTKKLDAIESQLKSFHNNMKTWDELARGVAPSIGGEQSQALAGKLKAMDFGNIKAVNEIELKIKQAINDPSAAAYMIGAMAVAMDFARIQTGPQSAAQLTEGARNDAIRLISAGINDKAREAVLGALESDAMGQVKGLKDQTQDIKDRLIGRGKKADKTAATGKPTPTQADRDAAKKLPGGVEQFKAHFGVDP